VFGPSELEELDLLELERLQLTLDELAELGGSELDELLRRLEKLVDDLLEGGKNEELLAELLEELMAELFEELLMLLNKLAQTTPPIDGRCAGLLATPLLPCTPNSMDWPGLIRSFQPTPVAVNGLLPEIVAFQPPVRVVPSV
jgi:hypothetical protein